MITKLTPRGDACPKITKAVCGKDCSLFGAFEYGTCLNFTVEVPRELGASAVVLRVRSDDTEREWDIPLTFLSTDAGTDTYSCEACLAEWCAEGKSGLFFYEFLFLRGFDTLFTDSINNVDFTLSAHSAERFVLTVYEKGFSAPSWFSGGVMYHVFVDRFMKGEGEVDLSRVGNDAELNEDWENGVPQYPINRGDPLKNNVFFGGNLWGVAEKLPYLKSLGVTVIYLSPIFKAYSNHKYDTGNYLEVDPMFGGDEAFENLVECAEKEGIKIILDGVFNHTGDDSLYFDKYSKYGKTGAYSNENSPFKNWFHFKNGTLDYESWWGIDILPKLDLNCEECREFLAGKGGVAEKYIKKGIGGWRLDVADELNDTFLDTLNKTVKNASDNEAIIIGEVWENAATKSAYGRRRRYFRGGQLDSVMNYPLRNGILGFVRYKDAKILEDILKELYSSYPKSVCDSLMNILGTHDTERVLTLLGTSLENEWELDELSNSELAIKRLSTSEYAAAKQKLLVASVIQYTVFGVPSVFYGDEAGLEGYHDPFCRRPYPWGREDEEIVAHYKLLGKIRNENDVFADGDFKVLASCGAFIAYERRKREKCAVVLANMEDVAVNYDISGTELLSGKPFDGIVPPRSAKIVYFLEGES